MSLSFVIVGFWMVDLGVFVNIGFVGWKWLVFCVIIVWVLGVGFVYLVLLGLDMKSVFEFFKIDVFSKELE